MDIMMRLKGAGFSVIANEFRQREKRLGSGLPLQDFIEIVLQGLPKPKTHEEKVANINALVDLFEDMDINGDGTMEFDEFTSYCVDAGMVATRNKSATLKHRYVRNTKHVIKTMNGAVGVEKVRWSPLFKRFLVLENAAKSVKIFNADGYMVGDVRSQSTLLNAPPSEDGSSPRANGVAGRSNENVRGDGSPRRRIGPTNDRAEPSNGGVASATTGATVATSSSTTAANTGIFILDAAFLHKFQCLAMSTTDFVISFYSMEEPKHQQRLPTDMLAASMRSGPSYDVIPKLTITTTTAQLMLRFCEEAGLLFSSGNDFIVNVWKISDMETKTLWKRLIHHQEMAMDIVEIPLHDLLASCDLNHTVQLWDIHDCRPRGELVGHTRGIKQMVFSKDHDMLLTAGFEFDAYGWDIASRQVVMKLVGHRAPLIGVQLALFQTERAITADASGVFKVWDISRATGGSAQSAAVAQSSRQGGRGASHALLLESLDPSHELSRFEPTTFISLHPVKRDLWAAASGSATLHLFRPKRVQQFDEIPLKAFYHYNANRFVVVCGPVCSIWDGEVGACVDEFTQVGALVAASARHGIVPGADPTSKSHSGAETTSGAEPSTDILLCVQDSKCKKLVVLSEEGDMGVFNCQNFVQMRRCEEKFCSVPPHYSAARGGARPPSSCGIVGLHYCSENKVVIAADAHSSSILVIDDSNNDSAKGIKETAVLRRLVHIPGGIAASAYSYHASMVATLDADSNRKVSLWDFETLTSVGICQLEDDDPDTGPSLQLLSFWEHFPVLLGSDSQGCVYFFAVMSTVQAKAGKLLHAFVNNHTLSAAQQETAPPSIPEAGDGTDEIGTESGASGGTFITESAETAARKFLLKRNSMQKSKTSRKSIALGGDSAKGSIEQALGGVVTCMQIVLDDADEQQQYLLFTGDERGVIRVWNLNGMMRRLSLFKIPETGCKYLRRGYHPRAMFSHDCSKQANIKASISGDNSGMSEPMSIGDSRISQAQLKKLTKQRADAKKKLSVTATSQLAKILPPNRIQQGHAPPSESTVSVAEAFLLSKQSSRRSTTSMSRANTGTSQRDFLSGGAMINARARPAESRRRSECWLHQDVNVVSVWVAHSDGITSLEVTKNPNIVVTCSLDMRVFVWSWQGACLGKLFDADNIGPCRWRFRKDDSKRDAERKLLLGDLMDDLELSPQEKAIRRRQTLYQDHVQRKSQKELPYLNVMLLDHIVSQHPEVAAMEKEGLSSAMTDEKINAEMEKARQRNFRAKLSMLQSLERASMAPVTASTSRDIVRIHSLAQVGPLLCVDKFEMKGDAQQMKFLEKEELKMDRKYLEDELAIGVNSSTPDFAGSRRASLKTGNLASIKGQIRAAQRHAEEMMENKVALQRHASTMYSNLRQSPRKGSQQSHDAMLLSRQTGDRPEDPEKGSTNQRELDELLEPSAFLRSKLPETALSVRPQTAPSPKTKNFLRRTSSNIGIRSTAMLPTSRLMPASSITLRPLTASVSETSLTGTAAKVPSSQPRSSLVQVSSSNRRSSLDLMYVEEMRRQNRSPAKRSHVENMPFEASDETVDNGSLRKLDSINAIINRAQSVCTANAKADDVVTSTPPSPQQRASTAPPSSLGTERKSRTISMALPTLHEANDAATGPDEQAHVRSRQDQSVLREHLKATRRRMEIAMGDNERSSERGLSQRSLINKKRHQVERVKKGKRMEDYLQQKRREMNANIGAVFKRTSFAFPTAGAVNDDAAEKKSEKARKKGANSAADPIDHRTLQEAQVQVEKSKVFGIYGVKEVMSIIRLFWSMDEDGSGMLTLAELLTYKAYFEKLGYHDMATVFQAIDKDGSGNVSLKELLEICFQYASKYQIEEMLKLAKLGDVATYFDATRSHRSSLGRATSKTESSSHTDSAGAGKAKADHVLTPEERAELMAIYRVFDRDGDGGVSMEEIMEALHVEEDETFSRIEAAEEAQLAERNAASGNTKRRASMAVAASPPKQSASAFTKAEVRKLYDDVDTDGDRNLDFDEFVTLMQTLHGSRR